MIFNQISRAILQSGGPVVTSGGGGGTPAWLSGVSLNTWTRLTGVNVAAGQTGYSTPNGPKQFPFTEDGKPGIFAWSGGAACGSKIIHTGGGHTNYSGNEVLELDLSQDSPAWVCRRNPTANGSMVENAEHYSDGSPTSQHNYSQAWWDEVHNKYLTIGIGSGYGGNPANSWVVDGWDLTTYLYDNETGGASVTYPSSYGGFSHQTDLPACQDANGDVWIVGPNAGVVKYTMSTRTYASAGSSNWHYAGSGSAAACGYDTTRDRFIVFADDSSANKIFTVTGATSTTESSLTFTGANAALASDLGHSCWYIPTLDRYLFWTADSGDSNVYQIHPTTWAVTTYSVSGTPPPKSSSQGYDKAYHRFLHVPEYSIIVHYGHTTSDDLYFFRYA